MTPSETDTVTEQFHKLVSIAGCRHQFPLLRQYVNGKPLVYFDNAATSQKPQAVIDAITRYYQESNSNIHRGVHSLSERATQSYEDVRHKVRAFLNAGDHREIVFVRGATEAINLVAHSFGRLTVREGDEILISGMEHHSNIVPWQILCEERHAHLHVIPITDSGELDLEAFPSLLTEKTRILAITHVSNALGTVNPIKQLITQAHAKGIPVLVDGAQAVPHMHVDVQDLDCDFYAFSAHKMFGPTGVGVLYAKSHWLEAMPPYQGGGDMIKSVTFEKTIYNDPPYKFEAGTPNIGGCIGLGAALDYLKELNMDAIRRFEDDLLAYATAQILTVPGVRIIGTAREKAGVLSFVMEGFHPHDIGTVLDVEGVAIRTGHHCAQPVVQRFGLPATARASFAFYNTKEEIDAFIKALHKVREVLG
jgi:cysteine desulfurase/selenocysteine lyase